LELAEQIAVEQVYPANAEADKIGAKYDPATKSVAIPQGFQTAMKSYREAGFSGLSNDQEFGGTACPKPFTAPPWTIFLQPALLSPHTIR